MKIFLFGIVVLLFLIWRVVDRRKGDGDELVYYDGCDLEALAKEDRKIYLKTFSQIAVAIAFIVAICLFL